ncbi:MAG: hypothetical protein MUC68_14200 [Burkholderiaceae bacterium]|jgi:hypothetical protein|nr:hypothetical protein [Burkholderiaceae bacterium]
MCALLIVYLLVIETAAAQPQIARPSRGFGDTMQFCWNERGAWQLRTRALDHAVEVTVLGALPPDAVEARAAHEAAMLDRAVLRTVTIIGADSRSTLRSALRRQHLSGIVEGPDDAPFAYWAPVPLTYRITTVVDAGGAMRTDAAVTPAR